MALLLHPSSFNKVFVQKILPVVLLLLFTAKTVFAADVSFQARVTRVVEEKTIEVMGASQIYQKLELTILSGDRKNEVVVVENGNQPLANVPRYRQNDRVIVTVSDGENNLVITDYVRQDALLLLLIIFIVLIVLVTKWKGVSSVLGMAFTFMVLVFFVLPQISTGRNPVVIAIFSSIVVIPVSFYLSHGLNLKTTIAVFSSVISLVVTSLLAFWFINITSLTGFSSEEAGMLSIYRQGTLNMQGLLLAGIVIGALGVLDDITISQAAIVDELASTAHLTKFKDLYSRAMIIGKDHITSMVNTLVLAYAGVSLPLLLIFVDNPHPVGEIINYEMIAEEIVRTLVGSIGLVIAVPVTTFIAAVIYSKISFSSSSKSSLGR